MAWPINRTDLRPNSFQSPISRTVAGQTSVIQSTKAYQNGSSGAADGVLNGAGLITDFLAAGGGPQPQLMDCGGMAVKSNNNNYPNSSGSTAEQSGQAPQPPLPTDSDSLMQQHVNHVVEMNNLLNAYANNGGGIVAGAPASSDFMMNDVEMENGHSHVVSNSSNGECGGGRAEGCQKWRRINVELSHEQETFIRMAQRRAEALIVSMVAMK